MTKAPPRRVIVLRPEPGASATVQAARALGLDAVAMPLFAVVPCVWDVPDPAAYQALLLTSANAVRHGGAGLAALRHIPAWCVGTATADAARAAGFPVAIEGASDVAALLARAASAEADGRPLLWLAGADRTDITGAAFRIDVRVVYQAMPLAGALSSNMPPSLFLAHSARAARELALLLTDSGAHDIVAISQKVAAAAGPNWRTVSVADAPTDAAVLALAAKLCQNGGQS